MSQSFSIPFHRPDGREHERGRGHYRFLHAVVVLIAGTLGLAIAFAMSTVDVSGAALAEEPASAESLAAFPSRELPPEWRWKPQPLDVSYMYRKVASPRRDWIRNGGAR